MVCLQNREKESPNAKVDERKNTASVHSCFAPLKKYDSISLLGRATNIKRDLKFVLGVLWALKCVLRKTLSAEPRLPYL